MIPLQGVTRLEVVDHTGRAYSVKDATSIQVDFQDGGSTLKIFIDPEQETS